MNITSLKVCLLIGIALFPCTSSTALAADKDDKQARATQRRLQQMQQAQQKLEQENASLKEQLKELEARFSATQAKFSAQKQSLTKLQALNSEQDSQVSACQSAQLVAQEAARNELEVKEAQRKQLGEDKAKLEIALSQQKTEVQACQQKNTNLINASLELMKKYEKKALSGVEPLTGLKGVEIENSFQAYRDQTENQYYRPGRK